MNHSYGIEDISISFPALYMDLADLAKARKIEPAKLQKGLGLYEMSLCDSDEDVITLAANALLDIVKNNNIDSNDLGRIYVGTESSIDGSKPIASYILGILTQYYVLHGKAEDCLRHVDVVDMTFACIGAIDAMHNSLAWLHTEPSKKAIVIATDIANYDLDSSGEYTQGAGATAVLLSTSPTIMEIDPQVGVSAACVHDFFKPLRLHSNKELNLKQNSDVSDYSEEVIAIHRETPIFDGPLSNRTYQTRITEALQNYGLKKEEKLDLDVFDAYIFHLPYAFHGRRIFSSLFLDDLRSKGKLESFYQSLSVSQPDKNLLDKEEYKVAKRAFNKAITKSTEYKHLVTNKIERGERLSSTTGNVYTASIFLALISELYYANKENKEMNNVLFFAYGSGSKAKVFKGTMNSTWNSKVSEWNIESQLKRRQNIDFDTYVKLRLHQQHTPVSTAPKSVQLKDSGILETNRYERNYVFVDA